MSVKAPAEKNFRRARTRARPARRRKLRALFSWRVARGLLIVTLIALAAYRAVSMVYYSTLFRVSRVRVQGNAPGLERRGAGHGPRSSGRSHSDRGSRTVAHGAARVPVAGRRRAPPRPAVDDRCVHLGAAAIRTLPPGRPALPGGPRRHVDGRVRAQVRRLRPADHRRPVPTAEPVAGLAGVAGAVRTGTDGRSRSRGARRQRGGRAAVERRAHQDRLADRRQQRCTTRSCCSTTIRCSCTSGTSAFASACSRTWVLPTRSGRASPISTTWIFVSSNAFT